MTSDTIRPGYIERLQRILFDYDNKHPEKVKKLKNIRDKVKDIYDRFPYTVHSDVLLTAVWVKEVTGKEIPPEILAFLQQYNLTISSVERAGRYHRANSEGYTRNKDYQEQMESAYVRAFCSDVRMKD